MLSKYVYQLLILDYYVKYMNSTGPEALHSEGMQVPIVVLGYSGQPKDIQCLSGCPEFENVTTGTVGVE
jgi:hypothetical protein